MFRQPLVHECVVGRQQVHYVAIFTDDAVEEELGLAPHRSGERFVVLRIEQIVWKNLVEILET